MGQEAQQPRVNKSRRPQRVAIQGQKIVYMMCPSQAKCLHNHGYVNNLAQGLTRKGGLKLFTECGLGRPTCLSSSTRPARPSPPCTPPCSACAPAPAAAQLTKGRTTQKNSNFVCPPDPTRPTPAIAKRTGRDDYTHMRASAHKNKTEATKGPKKHVNNFRVNNFVPCARRCKDLENTSGDGDCFALWEISPHCRRLLPSWPTL